MNLDLLLGKTNDQHLTSSIVLDDFNVKCLEWCSSDETRRASLELGNIRTTVGYSQLINKTNQFAHDMSSCITLLFYSYASLFKTYGNEVKIKLQRSLMEGGITKMKN